MENDNLAPGDGELAGSVKFGFCRDCKHWRSGIAMFEAHEGGRQIRRCSVLGAASEKLLVDDEYGNDMPMPAIRTSGDFGCAEFERREP